MKQNNDFEDIAKSYFQQELSKRNPEDIAMCVDIIDEILGSIMQHYEDMQVHNSTTERIRSNKGIWGQLQLRNQIQQKRLHNTLYGELESQIMRKIQHKGIQINHIVVHQQFVPNLCGYHASFNLIQSIHCAKFGQPIQINKPASFWSYLRGTQSFLNDYANKNGLDRTKWPWQEKDIRIGDFERTHWITCIRHKPVCMSTFMDEKVDGIKYTVRHATIYFQYGHLVPLHEEQRRETDQAIQDFLDFKPSPKNVMVLGCMMGITNHWVCLVAQKSIQGTDFFVFDSRNRDYLEWSDQEMLDFLAFENGNRKNNGMPVWTQFYLDLYLQGMKDVQQCSRLVVEIFSGHTTIETFTCNARLRVFLNPLVQMVTQNDQQGFLTLVAEGPQIDKIFEQVNLWSQGYYETVRSYMTVTISDMTLENQTLLRKSIQIIQACYAYQLQNLQIPTKNPLQQIAIFLSTIDSRF